MAFPIPNSPGTDFLSNVNIWGWDILVSFSAYFNIIAARFTMRNPRGLRATTEARTWSVSRVIRFAVFL